MLIPFRSTLCFVKRIFASDRFKKKFTVKWSAEKPHNVVDLLPIAYIILRSAVRHIVLVHLFADSPWQYTEVNRLIPALRLDWFNHTSTLSASAAHRAPVVALWRRSLRPPRPWNRPGSWSLPSMSRARGAAVELSSVPLVCRHLSIPSLQRQSPGQAENK